MAELVVQTQDLVALAGAFRAAQQRMEHARSRFSGAAQAGAAMGRRDLEQQYAEAYHAMATALDQLITSLGKGAEHFTRVAGNYATTDRNAAT
jgi:heterodisulfide reductase subunit A-like polyferredoxin